MSLFLVVFDRATGRSTNLQTFAENDVDALMSARLAAEATAGPTTEVATLAAASISDLRKTHSRYFVGQDDLVENLRIAIAS